MAFEQFLKTWLRNLGPNGVFILGDFLEAVQRFIDIDTIFFVVIFVTYANSPD